MSDLRQSRLDKLQKLKSLGLEAYPQPNLEFKNTCQEAQKMLGKKVHDQFEVQAPAGKLTYKIVAIA